jgi:hypothetical protein
MAYSKRCYMCGRRLGLSVRQRNRWTGFSIEHMRFCDSVCELAYADYLRFLNKQTRWFSYLGST